MSGPAVLVRAPDGATMLVDGGTSETALAPALDAALPVGWPLPGLGRRLVVRVLEEAGAIGYRRIRLDTTPEMAGAIRLYESLGFTRTAPYRPNPVEGAISM